jgi:CheY-like chemotaxis protein
MDLQMPIMDGVTATREIRALDHPDARSIVILALTANVLKEDVASAMDAGMNGYIPKPINMAFFIDTLKKALEKKAG